jgi:alpha-1,3-rhamnosyl/mannosyltransferase
MTERARAPKQAPRRPLVPDRPPPRLLFNFTAYDSLASGARERAVGLCGALMSLGAEVTVAEARGADLAALLPHSPRVVRTPLDPGRPLERFRRSRRVFEGILRTESPDAFVTDFYPVPRVPGTRTVVTVHDLRDLAGAFRRPLRRAYFAAAYGRSLRRADRVVTPSAFTRDEAVNRLGIDPARTAVVPNAVGDALREPAHGARTRERLDLPRRPYLLALGVLEPRKNLATLLEAIRLLHDADATLPALVIAGRGGPEERRLRRLAAGLPVHWAGYVRPADLPALYAGARALIHPATYEGFGMPVVEAMAAGIPVACADASALPETAGGAALLFDPLDPESVASACLAVSNDETLRADLVRRGLARAAGLTWEAAARSLLDSLELSVPPSR